MTTFTETTEERYGEMLDVLPPAAYGNLGFLVGEPVTHRRCTVAGCYAPTYDAFMHWKGQYYASDEPMTVFEFNKLTLSDFRP